MEKADEGFFISKGDDTRLFWRSLTPDAPKAFVGIVHGYGDHSGRYVHVMQALAKAGVASLGVDYRGHGKAEGNRADVKRWPDYLGDLEVFWSRVMKAAAGKPSFLFAHSHGALMATHWAWQKPEGLKGLVLTSPFFKLALTPPPLKLLGAKVINKLLPGLHMSNELKVEQLSTDVEWQKSSSADPLYLHDLTPRWFFESQRAQEQLVGRGRDVTQPVLMMLGGDDPIASAPASKAYFETLGSADKTLKEYPGFRHEIWAEVGRAKVIADIVEWISSRS